MATEVDICNIALSYLGDRATVSSIDPPEGSAQADHCARFYPISCGQILAEHPWSFATRRAKLAKVAVSPTNAGSTFTLPNDCVRVVSVHDSNAHESQYIENYTLESFNGYTVITCACDDIYIKYVSLNTPSAAFTPLFTDALAHLLASKLAGPLVPGTSGASLAQEEMKIYNAFLVKAINQDAVQSYEKETYINPFVGDLSQGGFYGSN